MFSLRESNLCDLPKLQELFVHTIQAVCAKDYNSEQLAVWISGGKDKKRWKEMLKEQYVIVTENEDRIFGFATLRQNNYIDFFYVHKAAQRQGIGTRLYASIEEIALCQQQSEIIADVSITGRPFFEKMGFKVVKEQFVVRKRIKLRNYRMKKILSP